MSTTPPCGAYFGTGSPQLVDICERPEGHPTVAEDGIGHSPRPTREEERAERDAARLRAQARRAEVRAGGRVQAFLAAVDERPSRVVSNVLHRVEVNGRTYVLTTGDLRAVLNAAGYPVEHPTLREGEVSE